MSSIPAVPCPRPIVGARFTQLVSKSCYRSTNRNSKLFEFHNLHEFHETRDAATLLLLWGKKFLLSSTVRARPTPRRRQSHHICLNRVALVVQLCWIYLLFHNMSPLHTRSNPAQVSDHNSHPVQYLQFVAHPVSSSMTSHQPRIAMRPRARIPPNIWPLPSALPTQLPRAA